MKKILLSLKYTFRNRKEIINFIIIGLLFSLTIVVTIYSTINKNYLKNGIEKDSAFRTLSVMANNNDTLDENKEKIENIEHVIGVFKGYAYQYLLDFPEFSNNNLSGSVKVYSATNKTLPKIVEGTNFPDEDGNYIVCPQNFYPNGDLDFIRNLSKKDAFNIKKYLNKTIVNKEKVLNYSTNQREEFITDFTLVGLYENNSSVIDEYICYIPEKSLETIALNYFETDENFDLSLQRSLVVQVDEYKNINKVKNKLKNMGYYAENMTFIDQKVFNNIFSVSNKILLIIYFVTIIALIIILYKQFKESRNYYKLLYNLGYRYKDIRFIYIISNVSKLMLSLTIAIIGICLTKIGINMLLYYKPFIFFKWDIIINYNALLYLIVISIIVSIVISIINLKKLKENIILEES